MQRAQAALSQGDAAEQGWSTRLDAGNRPFELTGYLNSPLTLRIIDRAGFSLFPLINGLRQPLWLTNETISDGGRADSSHRSIPHEDVSVQRGRRSLHPPGWGHRAKWGRNQQNRGCSVGMGMGMSPCPSCSAISSAFPWGSTL